MPTDSAPLILNTGKLRPALQPWNQGPISCCSTAISLPRLGEEVTEAGLTCPVRHSRPPKLPSETGEEFQGLLQRNSHFTQAVNQKPHSL